MTLLVRLECPLDGPNVAESQPGFDAESQVAPQGSGATFCETTARDDDVRRETCEMQDRGDYKT
ncbi:MAG: hypothetical protein ACXVGO_13070 [Mycobacterium sp.]